MSNWVKHVQGLLQYGIFPDPLLRWGMRQALKGALQKLKADGVQRQQERLKELIQEMQKAPIAVFTRDANEQHYELPTEFFQLCLGDHLKYSSCYFETGQENLSQAEAIMLEKTCQRADLQNGQQILELGCGWGSLSLWMAKHFPKSHITAVSNSRTQKAFIDQMAKDRGLMNLTIITQDMNQFECPHRVDRIVSVEMFEHMRNWPVLLSKCAKWLNDDGRMFIHIFTHKEYAYLYDHQDPNDFIGKYFFTGGIMPSDHLLYYLHDDLIVDDHWRVDGRHYGLTARWWLNNMDQNRERIMPLIKQTYGEKDSQKWWHYWRIFYMACEELWSYDNGQEWMVSHYRLKKKLAK